MRRIWLAALMMVASLIALFDAPAGVAGGKQWYLMEPPVDDVSDLESRIRDQAPLTQWTRIATYGTEAACVAKRNEAVAATTNELLRLSKSLPLPKVEIFEGAYRDSRLADESVCVSADDPRLISRSARESPDVTGLRSSPPSLLRDDDILQ